MVKDIKGNIYNHFFLLSKINSSLLRKYDISLSVEDFKYYAMMSMIPSITILTGNKYNSKQQKHTRIYNLQYISEFLKR